MSQAANVTSVILIGSRAYPEFARPDSDVDLIVTHDADTDEVGYITLLELAAVIGDDDLLVETRIFNRDQLRQYALSCELVKQFAFIRGYSTLTDGDRAADAAIELCVARYWTDTYRVYRELKDIDTDAKLESLRYYVTDCHAAFHDERLACRDALHALRLAEVVKDFLSGIWALDCAYAARHTELWDVDPHNALLGSIGLLRVFSEPRGGRVIDFEKYAVPAKVKRLVVSLDAAVAGGWPTVFDTIDREFQEEFGRSVFVTGKESARAVVWR